MTKTHIVFIFSILAFSGCGLSETASPDISYTRLPVTLYNAMENSLLDFNGEVYLFSYSRQDTHGSGFTIFRLSEDESALQEIRTVAVDDMGLCSSIIFNGRCYVFGTSDWASPGNSISMISSEDLINWTSKTTIFTADSSIKLFNTSVTYNPTTEEFVLAYEYATPGEVPFSERFLFSSDLDTWSMSGTALNPDEYSACPCIRYFEGYYYIFWLESAPGYWRKRVSRTVNFTEFEKSPLIVLDPKYLETDINTSDMDMIDRGDHLVISYAVGNQMSGPTGYANIRLIRYEGSMAEFTDALF